MERRS